MSQGTVMRVVAPIYRDSITKILPGALFWALLLGIGGGVENFLSSLWTTLLLGYLTGLVVCSFTWPFTSWAAAFWYRHDDRLTRMRQTGSWDDLLSTYTRERAFTDLMGTGQAHMESVSLINTSFLLLCLGCFLLGVRLASWLYIGEIVREPEESLSRYVLFVAIFLAGLVLLGVAYPLLLRFHRRTWALIVLYVWTILLFMWGSTGLAVMASPSSFHYLIRREGTTGTFYVVSAVLFAWLTASASYLRQRRRVWGVAVSQLGNDKD